MALCALTWPLGFVLSLLLLRLITGRNYHRPNAPAPTAMITDLRPQLGFASLSSPVCSHQTLGQRPPEKRSQENDGSFLTEVCQSLTVRIAEGRELGRAGPELWDNHLKACEVVESRQSDEGGHMAPGTPGQHWWVLDRHRGWGTVTSQGFLKFSPCNSLLDLTKAFVNLLPSKLPSMSW